MSTTLKRLAFLYLPGGIIIRYIITYFPEFKKNAYKEIEKAGGKAVAELDKSISVVETASASFVKQLLKSDPIFVRHIMPVLEEGKISDEQSTDCENILESAKKICRIDNGGCFSVQCRILNGGMDYSAKDIEVFVGTFFDKQGGIPLFSDTDIMNKDFSVISIFIYESIFYIGFSAVSENLNSHCDEYRILSRKGREISRAENKLKEAITKFKIEIKGEGYALDIGASPGGWTKVLADYGFRVYAVDPGNLKECLNGHPNITHFKDRIENIKFDKQFEIIVNDMNINPNDTAKMMCELAPRLVDNGLAVVTLKLPFADADRSIKESTEILSEQYDIISIKNLTHNRAEVTALIRKK